ncbi:sensor histidine kinase [Arthrobacter sp. CG_A4]|uniref:sensor histidine kinase n=1 Tax=Arthrobacter sp. CG_A4 TaxID=3071706 RepID=UPI002E150206
MAVIRLVAVPVFFLAERLVEHPEANQAPFTPMLLLAALYAAAAMASELRSRPLINPAVLTTVDIILIAALVATSGGPFSQLRYAFFLLPIGAALLMNPRLTATFSAAGLVLYALIAVTYPESTQVRRDAVGFEVTQILFLAWTGAAATVLSAILARRTREVSELSAVRGRLVAQALDAEDQARKMLATSLHDHALQNLLAARHLLGSEGRENAMLISEGLDRGISQIREAVFDLHPYVLDPVGLRGAIHAIAARAGDRGGFAAFVEVQPAASGVHDQLLFAIARELVSNCVQHAHADTLSISVRRLPDTVEMMVVDDGVGIDVSEVEQAPLNGHIGLASCAERASAIGGSFEYAAGKDGRGTQVRVSLPMPARAKAA